MEVEILLQMLSSFKYLLIVKLEVLAEALVLQVIRFLEVERLVAFLFYSNFIFEHQFNLNSDVNLYIYITFLKICQIRLSF